MTLPIYFDNNATTPVDPDVLVAMEAFHKQDFGNPSSSHAFGWQAKTAVTKARRQIAVDLGTKPMNIYFTSGATESNNMVIQGLVLKSILDPMSQERPHIITTNVEHKCILEACSRAEGLGADVTIITADKNGCVSADEVLKALRPQTKLVSIMYANNEIGSINPIAEIGAVCRAHGVLFHTDAAQAFGKRQINVVDMKIDFLSLSGHKIYGPKGVGALFCGHRPETVLAPLIVGGAQERGLRSGTHNVAGIVGLGKASEKATSLRLHDRQRLTALRNRIIAELRAVFPELIVNGHQKNHLCGNLSLSFPGINSRCFEEELKDLAFSRSSACSTGAFQPSYVLKAIGHSDELAASTIRLGLGRFTKEKEVTAAIESLSELLKSTDASMI